MAGSLQHDENGNLVMISTSDVGIISHINEIGISTSAFKIRIDTMDASTANIVNRLDLIGLTTAAHATKLNTIVSTNLAGGGNVYASFQAVIDSTGGWELSKSTITTKLQSVLSSISTGQLITDGLMVLNSTAPGKIQGSLLGLVTGQLITDGLMVGNSTAPGKLQGALLHKATAETLLNAHTAQFSNIVGSNVVPTTVLNVGSITSAGSINIGTNSYYGDGSKLQNLAAGTESDPAFALFIATFTPGGGAGDSFGSHTATKTIQVATQSLVDVASISFANPIGLSYPMRDGMRLLGSTFVATAIATMSVTFSSTTYIYACITVPLTSVASDLMLQFNQDFSSRSYCFSRQLSFATAVSSNSHFGLPLGGASTISARNFYVTIPGGNLGNTVFKPGRWDGVVASSGATPQIITAAFNWSKGNSGVVRGEVINKMTVSTYVGPGGGGTLGVGSCIAIYGRNY